MFPPTQFDLQQHNALSAGLNWAEWSIYSLFPRGKASAKCCKVHENHGDNRFWSLQKHESISVKRKVRFFKLQWGGIKAVKERLYISENTCLIRKKISCSCFASPTIEATVKERKVNEMSPWKMDPSLHDCDEYRHVPAVYTEELVLEPAICHWCTR